MKVYTRSGDGGKTSLVSGERIDKSDGRIDAYGTVDELNSIVGWVIANLPQHKEKETLRAQLGRIQSELFIAGSLLATSPGSPAASRVSPITIEYSRRLEEQIDAMYEQLSPVDSFIIPGGHPSAAAAHVARTVCRRAERRVAGLAASEIKIPYGFEPILVYLNRLSDYFFVLARYCNSLAGVTDEPLDMP